MVNRGLRKMTRARDVKAVLIGYVVAVLSIALVTVSSALFRTHMNDATVALVMLLMVLFVASLWGSGAALVAAVLAMLCFNFFLAPIGKLTISDTENSIALSAFLITAVTVGQLSGRAKRRAAEAEAGRREARLASAYNRSLIEASLDPFVAIGKDGKITDANQATEKMAGRLREQIIGTDFSDYFTEPESARAAYQQVFREGFVSNYPLEVRHIDGHTTPVLYNASLYRDEAGQFAGVFAAARDITERKLVETALMETEADLEKAQEIAHIGSWNWEIKGRRFTGSDEMFRIFGLPRDQVRTYEDLLSVIHPDDRTLVAKTWSSVLRGTPCDIEHRVTAGGQVKWVRERARVDLNTAGRPAKLIGTAQDVTERKLGQEQLLRINRANRALSRCNQAMVRATDELPFLQQLCDLVVQEAGYRLCWVGYAEGDAAKSVRPLAHAGFDDGYLQNLRITWSDTERGQGPTGTCIRTGETVLVRNVATDLRMTPWREEALKRGYASSIAIPLFVDTGVFGALTIYSQERDAFSAEEVELLTELASDLAFGITALRTRAERARAEAEIRTINAELEQRVAARTAELESANRLKDELILREQEASAELELAREREAEVGFRIQQTLLLDHTPIDVPGLSVAALTIPSQRIDGDFYVFFKHRDQSLDVIVGDVMGKGIPAALLGAATKSQLLKALSHLIAFSRDGKLPEPKEIVALAHAEIVHHLIELESFVTLCYARLDVIRRTLQLVDCGHTGIVHVHGKTGVREVLRGENLPLGVRERETYSQVSVPFGPGDLFVVYSDGITEARNPAGELFGGDRLEQLIQANSRLAPVALVEEVRKAVFGFSQSSRLADDLPSVAVRVEGREDLRRHEESVIRSDLRELSRARKFVREFCRSLPGRVLDQYWVSSLELAVNEAACNVMKHAYHGRKDQSIYLEGEALPARVTIRLHHQGDPFDPSKPPPPVLDGSRESGFGAYLISKSVDDARYDRDESGRNCITLVKALKS